MNHKNLFKDLETLREIIVTFISGQESNLGKTPELEQMRQLVNFESPLKTIIKEQNFKALEAYTDIKKIIQFAENNTLEIFEEIKQILVFLKKDYYYIFFK